MSSLFPEMERKEKVGSMPEEAARLLVDLYIQDEKLYNQRLMGGSKIGKAPRKLCMEKWKLSLAAIGCDRTEEQIANRIKGDIQLVKSILSTEKVERSRTGGGLPKKMKKLDCARLKLYEHFQGSHVVNGMSQGYETSSKKTDTETFDTILDIEPCETMPVENKNDEFRLVSKSSSSIDMFSSPPRTPPSEKIPSSSAMKIGNEKDEKNRNVSTFKDYVRNSAKKRTFQSTGHSELSELRLELVKAEIAVAEKKARNLDEKFTQMRVRGEILNMQKIQAKCEMELAKSRADMLGLDV